MPYTDITTLPAAPSRLNDSPATFVVKADAFVAALAEFITDTNAAGAYIDTQAAAAATSATDSSTSATAAAASATTAAGHVTTASQWAEAAEDTEVASGQYSALHHAAKAESHKDAAQTAAAAAGAAAGLPTFSGNSRKSLLVNEAEDGVEWGIAVPKPNILNTQIESKLGYSTTKNKVLRLTDTTYVYCVEDSGGNHKLVHCTVGTDGTVTFGSVFTTSFSANSYYRLVRKSDTEFYYFGMAGSTSHYYFSVSGTTIGSETAVTGLPTIGFAAEFYFQGSYMYIAYRDYSSADYQAACYTAASSTSFTQSGSDLYLYGSSYSYLKGAFDGSGGFVFTIGSGGNCYSNFVDFSGNSTPVRPFSFPIDFTLNTNGSSVSSIFWLGGTFFGILYAANLYEGTTDIYWNQAPQWSANNGCLCLAVFDVDDTYQSNEIQLVTQRILNFDSFTNVESWERNFEWYGGNSAGFILEFDQYSQAGANGFESVSVSYLSIDTDNFDIDYSHRKILPISNSGMGGVAMVLTNNSDGTAHIASGTVDPASNDVFVKVTL